jgi:hypothetical protein
MMACDECLQWRQEGEGEAPDLTSGSMHMRALQKMLADFIAELRLSKLKTFTFTFTILTLRQPQYCDNLRR